MKRFLSVTFALIAISTAGGSSAMAYTGPCNADIAQFCFDVQPGYGAISTCIDQHRDEFSYGCREWLKKSEAALRKIGADCSDDVRTYCRDVRPGAGALKNCLSANMDKLSDACRDHLK
jgi:hypothetical protein